MNIVDGALQGKTCVSFSGVCPLFRKVEGLPFPCHGMCNRVVTLRSSPVGMVLPDSRNARQVSAPEHICSGNSMYHVVRVRRTDVRWVLDCVRGPRLIRWGRVSSRVHRGADG